MKDNHVAELFNVRSHNPSYFSVKDSITCQEELLDFCIPVNLYFPPNRMIDEIHRHLPEILRYYPDYAQTHAENIGAITGLPAENIVPANGSTEIITTLCQRISGPIVTSIPTFSRWTDLPAELNLGLYTIERKREHDFRLCVSEIVKKCRNVSAGTLVISNPNNPTGAALTLDEIGELVTALPSLDALIVDESFIDFSDLQSAASLAIASSNLIVVKSLGKSLGWHGVRLGYAITNTARARELRNRLPFWNINGIAAHILKQLPNYNDEFRSSFQKVADDRIYMTTELSQIAGLHVFPSQANFLFVELAEGVAGRDLRNRLVSNHGVMIRECSNKLGSSERYLRLAVQKPFAVDRLIGALHVELDRPLTNMNISMCAS